jgi:hypothetical protein
MGSTLSLLFWLLDELLGLLDSALLVDSHCNRCGWFTQSLKAAARPAPDGKQSIAWYACCDCPSGQLLGVYWGAIGVLVLL